jgi:hypothetical protein
MLWITVRQTQNFLFFGNIFVPPSRI